MSFVASIFADRISFAIVPVPQHGSIVGCVKSVIPALTNTFASFAGVENKPVAFRLNWSIERSRTVCKVSCGRFDTLFSISKAL